MLVQCEFYEADGRVTCDVICEKCGEVAQSSIAMSSVIDLVHGSEPVICFSCQDTKCRKCGRFPTNNQRWVNGVCWDCRDKAHDELVRVVNRLHIASLGE